MRKLALAIALSLPVAPIQAATTDVFKFSFAEGFVEVSFSDSCSLRFVRVIATTNGSKNGLVSKNTPFAYAEILTFDQCNNSLLSFEFGSTNNILFSAPPGTTGTQLPKSVTASGVIPLEDCCGWAPPDRLTFNMTLKPVGGVSQILDTQRQTFTLAQKPPLMIGTHQDSNFSRATASVLTISTQNLGTIPTSNHFGSIADGKSHSVSITH